MAYLKKIGKVLLITFSSIIVLGLLLNTLYYFDIINNNIYNIMKLVIILIVLFINALILGKNTEKYGILEGLKLGAIFLLIMMLIKIITNNVFDIRTVIYSLIIILTTTIGSIIGINKMQKKQ